MNKTDLMVPLFALYNFSKIDEISFTNADAVYLKDYYSLTERQDLYNVLLWAKVNPTYDFKGIMEDAPAPHKLQFSNKEIYKYLMEFKSFMENNEYELLTDERPPAAF